MDNLQTLRKLYLKCRMTGERVDPHIAAVAIRAVGDYAGIRSTYYNGLNEAFLSYLLGNESLSSAKNSVKRYVATGFVNAFEAGWVETQGAGATYDPDPEDSAWLATRMEQELAFVDGLFVTMKAMRDDTEEPMTDADKRQFAVDRATGYAASLDGVFGQGKLRSRKLMMLTLDGPDGKESCRTCQKYKGQRHRAKWWVSHDLVPAPGNESYECGGWQCQHTLSDDSGNQWAGATE